MAFGVAEVVDDVMDERERTVYVSNIHEKVNEDIMTELFIQVHMYVDLM